MVEVKVVSAAFKHRETENVFLCPFHDLDALANTYPINFRHSDWIDGFMQDDGVFISRADINEKLGHLATSEELVGRAIGAWPGDTARAVPVLWNGRAIWVWESMVGAWTIGTRTHGSFGAYFLTPSEAVEAAFDYLRDDPPHTEDVLEVAA